MNAKYLSGLWFALLLVWTSYSAAEQIEIASSKPVTAEMNRVAIEDSVDTQNLIEQNFPPAPSDTSNQSETANPEMVKPNAVKVGSGSHLANVALGLMFIVLLILALGWFMRRFNQGGLFNNSAIKIVAVTPLGTRERLLVVDISGQQLLLGVTATQINTLHVFNEPVVDANSSPGASDFGRKLLAALQQKTTNQTSGAKDHSAN